MIHSFKANLMRLWLPTEQALKTTNRQLASNGLLPELNKKFRDVIIPELRKSPKHSALHRGYLISSLKNNKDGFEGFTPALAYVADLHSAFGLASKGHIGKIMVIGETYKRNIYEQLWAVETPVEIDESKQLSVWCESYLKHFLSLG